MVPPAAREAMEDTIGNPLRRALEKKMPVDCLRLFGVLLLGLLPLSPVRGQESTSHPLTIDVFVTVDRVSIYDGDATVGGYGNWGMTGSLAFRSRFPFGAEIFVPSTPKDTDPYSLTPRILLPGGWITLSLSNDPREGLDVFLAAGASYMEISGWPVHMPCYPPGCWREGGPSFLNGGSWSFVWGGGLTYRTEGRLTFRVDARVPSKTAEIKERTTRIGAGLGFRVR